MNSHARIVHWAIAGGTCALFIACVVTPSAWAGGSSRGLADKLRYGPGVINHPVGVKPSGNVRVPKDWPLEADGTIGCLTCHRGLPSLEGGTNPLLRVDKGNNAVAGGFCTNCHSSENGSKAQAIHWLAGNFAHVRPNESAKQFGSGRLDYESKRCLGCHDGVNASDSTNATHGSFSSGGFVGQRKDHPVGVRYPMGKLPGQSLYRHPKSLPASVRLPEGKVSCVSCHNLYARADGFLSVPGKGSKLCFTCHDME